MRKPMAALLVLAALLTGCSGSKNAKPFASTDNRMNNPSILNKDAELKQGDYGIGENRQSGPLHGLSVMQEVWPNPSIAPINGSYTNNVIQFGLLFLGTPYEYASNRDDPSTFDCSDFTRYSYLGALGMDLPMDSRAQSEYVLTYGKRQYTDLGQAQPGDLLFFMDYRGPRPEDYANINPANERISHVGIYIGDGKILHTASKATGGVRIDTLWGKHLQYRFIRGGSVLP